MSMPPRFEQRLLGVIDNRPELGDMDAAVVQRAPTTVTQQSMELGDTRRIRIACPLEQQITPVATRLWTSPAAGGEPQPADQLAALARRDPAP
jgi:hypothetical protein